METNVCDVIAGKNDVNKTRMKTSQYENDIEDLIITKSSQHNLQLALTKLYVPWCDESRNALSAKLKCKVIDHDEDYGPTFFIAGHLSGDTPVMCYSLYWEDRIIISDRIDFQNNEIIFIEATIFKLALDPCVCKECSREKSFWKKLAGHENFNLSLEINVFDSIYAACLHWHEFYCFGKKGKLILRNNSNKKSLGFEKIEFKVYGRNWSSVDCFDPLTQVSQVWSYPDCF